MPKADSTCILPCYFPEVDVIRAVVGWHNEFYSNTINREEYAQWCRDMGLEYDLTEETE